MTATTARIELSGRTVSGSAHLLVLTAMACAYLLSSELGLSLSASGPVAMPAWIPVGLGLAIFLIVDFRVWPSLLLCAFLASFIPTGRVFVSAGIAVASVLQSLAGAFFVATAARGRYALERAEDLFKFVFFAGIVTTALGATIGVTAIVQAGLGDWSDYTRLWLTWWVESATGVCVLAPLVILWTNDSAVRWTRSNLAEIALFFVALTVASIALLRGQVAPGGHSIRFMIFPFLLWAAIRFGQREAAAAVFVIALIAGRLWGSAGAQATSAFISTTQLLMAVMSITALSVGASLSGRKRAEAALLDALEEMEGKVDERTEALQQSERILQNLSARVLRLQDEERRRIARELHDSTGQKVAALSMNLSLVNREGGSLSQRARDALVECSGLADQCVQEMRTLSYLLHPPFLEELGLAAALRWYVTGFSERSGIQVQLDLPPVLRRAPNDVEIVLFRVVQECLTNIHRHSGSPNARIHLAADSTSVKLEVEDSGRGVSIETLESGETQRLGVGILGMRERVRQLGGQLELRSSKQGAVVSVSLPI